MSYRLEPPLTPRNGRKLKVLAVCRISTVHQDEKSLADQEAEYVRRIQEWTDRPYEMVTLASQGSGENLERADYLQALELVDTSTFDLVICEDMGRICRRVQAHLFAENCVDQKTRLIAINDHIDTARADWHMHSYFAVMRHESYNRDTSARIRRSLRNRFSQGGVVQSFPFGYVKAPGTKSDADVAKDPEAEPIYDEWFRILESGGNYAEVADWLNAKAIPPGPYIRLPRWTGTMVGRVTHNPILKGLRIRNKRIAKRINKTGKRVTVEAPAEEKLERNCPHLAFIEPDRYDRVITALRVRNACFKRRGIDGVDPRRNVSRKRTVWPGQHLQCGVCNRIYYWSGVGAKKLMRCSGNQDYRCWNGIEINGAMAAAKMAEAIFKLVMELPGFDESLIAEAREQWQTASETLAAKKKQVEGQLADLGQKIGKITDAIADGLAARSLAEKLANLEGEQDALALELRELSVPRPEKPELPSLEELRGKAAEVFTQFAPESSEISRLMHLLVPSIKVYPVRLCDEGAIVLRAHMQVCLTALTAERGFGSAQVDLLRHDLVVDLFEPPQREKHRLEVIRLRALGLTERKVAAQLGITQPAVQNAAALQRLMSHFGISDPYIAVTEAPADGGLRRHRHPRYRFEPLPDDSAG